MNKPTDEQIREFWEWCGFKYSHSARSKNFYTGALGRNVRFYSYPDGDVGEIPPIDLNNLFKYAVPNVKWIQLSVGHAGLYIAQVRLYSDNKESFKKALCEDKDPALALFWAIWEAINEHTT